MQTGRYYRMEKLEGIGPRLTSSLPRKTALVVGCGSLGTAAALMLARMGIGRLRVVDRDIVMESNLTDQWLFSEDDRAARRLKAEVTAEHLRRLNKSVTTEGVVADFGPDNAVALSEGCDVIIDGADNLYTKYLINDVSIATNCPWVYAGCSGTKGTVMAVVPERTHCLRCVWREIPAVEMGCQSAGLLPPTAAIIAAIQVVEALKILSGNLDEVVAGPLLVDAWLGVTRRPPVVDEYPLSDCPACRHRRFPFLNGEGAARTAVLCGGKTVLVDPGRMPFSYEAVLGRLARYHGARAGQGYLRFEADGCDIVLYESGRALVYGTADPTQSMALYARYVVS